MSYLARRRILLAGAASLAPHTVLAKTSRKIPRIGIVFNSFSLEAVLGENPAEPVMREFLIGLRQWGYVEGRNVSIERRSAEGQLDRLVTIIRDLAGMPVDVIVVTGNAATLAAKGVTTTVPIVAAGMATPVELGIVANLARPGGNVTGTVPAFGQELALKRLELLHQLLPRARRVVHLATETTPGEEIPNEVERAAKIMGLTLVHVDARLPRIEAGLHQAERQDADALLVVPTVPLYSYRKRIVEWAAKVHMPDIYGIREAVEAGGLASYGGDTYDLWRRTARYVHRILTGAKPGELPVEKTDRYSLMLNRERARALGITIPEAVRLRADQVI
jgi:putative ABC transport system substrate-binding protein